MERCKQFYGEKTVTLSTGTIKAEDNECSGDYDLIYWAYFVPNEFENNINILGECGFDPEYEKKEFRMYYYPECDTLIYREEMYRTVIIQDELFNRYKDNIIYRGETDIVANTLEIENNNYSLPWIRFPRTKDGITIPLLVERIFGRIPSKIIFFKKT
jgi:hypothetical protein